MILKIKYIRDLKNSGSLVKQKEKRSRNKLKNSQALLHREMRREIESHLILEILRIWVKIKKMGNIMFKAKER